MTIQRVCKRTRCAPMLLLGVIAPIWLASAFQARAQSSADRPPIIEHAHSLSQYGSGMPNCANDQEIVYPGADPREPFSLGSLKTCASPMPAAATHELLMKESLAALERHNIFAVTAGPLVNVRTWRAAAADRIIPALAFGDPGSPDVKEFRCLVDNRELAVFAEVSPQYEGMTLDDSRWDPYSTLAEELDIPVGVHLGEGPPGAPYGPMASYRVRLTRPHWSSRLRPYDGAFKLGLVDEAVPARGKHRFDAVSQPNYE